MQEQNNVEDYLYFLKYKNNLTQFIIHNCSYSKNKRRLNRVNVNEREMLSLLKELNEISLYIEKIK
tara:strand:+ start:400 stop:597 length:198 start_codon:yes stop_codon:yes gene_type:complete